MVIVNSLCYFVLSASPAISLDPVGLERLVAIQSIKSLILNVQSY